MLRPFFYRSLRPGMMGCGAVITAATTIAVQPCYCALPLQLSTRSQSTTTATQQPHNTPGRASSSSSSFRGRGRGGRGSGTRVHRGPLKDRYPPLATDLNDPRRRLVLLIDGTNTQLVPAGCTSVADIMQRSALYANVLPAVLRVGVPVLLRVFAQQLSAEWQLLCAGGPESGSEAAGTAGARHGLPLPTTKHTANTESNSSSTGSNDETSERHVEEAADKPDTSVQVEFFRVERFIPVPMQIEADAQHIYDYRAENKVEGVCYVCAETDRAIYERILQQQYEAAPVTNTSATGEATQSTVTSTAAFFNQYILDELGMVKERTVDGRPGDGA